MFNACAVSDRWLRMRCSWRGWDHWSICGHKNMYVNFPRNAANKYETGNMAVLLKSCDGCRSPSHNKRKIFVFQLLLYCMLLGRFKMRQTLPFGGKRPPWNKQTTTQLLGKGVEVFDVIESLHPSTSMIETARTKKFAFFFFFKAALYMCTVFRKQEIN